VGAGDRDFDGPAQGELALDFGEIRLVGPGREGGLPAGGGRRPKAAGFFPKSESGRLGRVM
jgi:hypothetical protein